jgi:signal transduction histidine kinase
MLRTRRREVAELALGNRWLHVVADPIPAGGDPGGTPPGEPRANSRKADGGVAGAVYIVSDVTEHRSLEAQLHHAQKMEAVGRLAGGVAHDFNNLLTGILGNVALLLIGSPKDTSQYAILQAVEQAGWRAAELVRQLLGFSRRTALHLRAVSLSDTIGEVVAILKQILGQRVQLDVRVAPTVPPVLADPSRLNQVLMNLCLNARDAMPEGGQLLLEGEGVVVDEEQARRYVGARAGRFVRLRVADTGHGIAPDVLPRIFEPFFTTKERGKGSGLGLSIVFGIVEQHCGWVECDSAVGHGTRFDVYLPADAREAAAPPPPPVPSRGNETVLLVDDDAMIRELGLTWLRRHGYEALAAEDGLAAVEIFARERGRVRLVVLNLEMPRLSGRAALERLLQLDPGVRVVIASGLGAEQFAGVGSVEGLLFVPKPYREEELLAAVRSALDRAAR